MKDRKNIFSIDYRCKRRCLAWISCFNSWGNFFRLENNEKLKFWLIDIKRSHCFWTASQHDLRGVLSDLAVGFLTGRFFSIFFLVCFFLCMGFCCAFLPFAAALIIGLEIFSSDATSCDVAGRFSLL